MKRLEEIPLQVKRGGINISHIRDLRFLMGQKVAYTYLHGDSELIGRNRRAAYPAGIFLSADASTDAKAEQIVTFYPQGVSRKSVGENEVILVCDTDGNIVLPENLKAITQDTTRKVTSFLLNQPSPFHCLGFAMLGTPITEQART